MLAATVEGLRDLDDAALTARFRALELELREREAEMAAVIAEGERRNIAAVDDHHSMKGWLAANANWSNAQIARRRRLSKLVDAIPDVGERLATGAIGVAQADELATVFANPRCADQLPGSIEVLLEHAEQLSFRDARTCLRRWQMFADLDGAHRDREISRAGRTATVAELDGVLYLSATGGTAEDAAEMTAIFQQALQREFEADVAERTRLHGADAPTSLLPRTDAQRRFDAVQAIFRRAVAVPDGARPPAPLVNLITDQRTLEETLVRHGLAPAPIDLPDVDFSERRCETADGTIVVPDVMLRAALVCHVRRVVVNSAGIPVEMGRKRRLFTGAARDAAKLMAHHCEFPGCDVPAAHAQVDHLDEFHEYGPTDPANSSIICGVHNRAKHRKYRARRDSHGRVTYYRRDGTVMAPVGRRLADEQPP